MNTLYLEARTVCVVSPEVVGGRGDHLESSTRLALCKKNNNRIRKLNLTIQKSIY